MSPDRQFALDVVTTLRRAGFQALWAGGCVRDQLMGLEPHDYDVATDALPEQVRKLFRRSIPIGAAFGVIEVLGPRADARHLTIQVATFRTESSYSDGRRPDSVEYCNAEEDARRRDFTINGMFFDPVADRVIDYVDGQTDLHAKILRAIGDPAARFAEDKLRLLRAVRFAARFGLQIESNTASALQAMSPQITVVSSERICDELSKMLVHETRARAVELSIRYGLLFVVVPELVDVVGDKEPVKEKELLAILGQLEQPSFARALAGLLYPLSPEVVGSISSRLRMSNSDRARTVWLIENLNAVSETPEMKLSRLKPLLAHPGIRELLDLHRAKALAVGGSTIGVEFCEERLSEWTTEELNPEPLLTGSDLIELGLTPGPKFKQILDAVRAAQLENRILAHEPALEHARDLIRKLS